MSVLLLIASLLINPGVFAPAQANSRQATRFDEFADVYPTDAAARLDNFAMELQKQHASIGFIVAYRSFRDLPGLSGRRVNWMRSYLIQNRDLTADRIIAIDGGEASCLMHELWVVPVGTTPKPRTDAYPRGFDDTRVAQKFDEYYWETPLSQPDSFSSEYGDTLEGFADALRKQPKAIAYIIGYAEYQLLPADDQNRQGTRARIDPAGTVAKKLAETKSRLVKLGTPATRIKAINGGYRNSRSMELWILPGGALAPAPTPNVLPKRR